VNASNPEPFSGCAEGTRFLARKTGVPSARPLKGSAPTRRFRLGLSLVEVMISTAIAATLLVAAGSAWSASCRSVEINDQFFRATQSARVAMLQMLTEIRRTTGVANDGLGDHVDLFTFNGKHYRYQYSSALQQLQLLDETPATPVIYVLARNVTSASFAAEMAPNPTTQISCAIHVTVTITIGISTSNITLTGSAAPRINVHY
jgi:type II secretory pathway pseudopilin PulG